MSDLHVVLGTGAIRLRRRTRSGSVPRSGYLAPDLGRRRPSPTLWALAEVLALPPLPPTLGQPGNKRLLNPNRSAGVLGAVAHTMNPWEKHGK
jgi:hypothetical protein